MFVLTVLQYEAINILIENLLKKVPKKFGGSA
jgi:hypothetical protein